MAYTTIDDPSLYFQIALYTGNGNTGKNIPLSSANFTGEYAGQDIQPDWIWIKQRGAATDHGMFDSSRGVTKNLKTNKTDAESTEAQSVTAFGSNDFTLGNSGDYNGADDEHVAWIWKANSGTVANDTNGDITTSVQASQTSGFSIATYTGNGGSGQTLGHGLGAEADLIIFKDRESASAWRTYVRLLGASKFLDLNTTNAVNTSSNIFPSASSTTIGVEQNDVMNKNNSDFVMYSFRSIQGYSKIGSYTGNGNTDGAFVYTGFKPTWILVKRTNGTQDWIIFDNKLRPANNVGNNFLSPNKNNGEDSSNQFDIVSNGFKLRMTSNLANGSGDTYIYMAFAEHPFVSSEGVPTTAR